MNDERTGAAVASVEHGSAVDAAPPTPARPAIDTAPRPIRLVPVDRVRVVNPRSRNRKKFQQIVENVARLGLKRPITVAVADGSAPDDPRYDLVCGQGRLEAFRFLGEERIPAIVINATREDQLVMSLAENIARRRPTNFEQVRTIAGMRERGYGVKEISEKVDLSEAYIHGVLKLWARGEEMLLAAVEQGRISVSVAVVIADTEDKDVQRVLASMYEQGSLRGKSLATIRRLWEARRDHGKALRAPRRKAGDRPTADDLVRCYQQEAERQRMFVKKAKLCENRLEFVVSALKKLFQDDNFVNVLRAEKIDTLPRNLAEQLGSTR